MHYSDRGFDPHQYAGRRAACHTHVYVDCELDPSLDRSRFTLPRARGSQARKLKNGVSGILRCALTAAAEVMIDWGVAEASS